MNDDPPPLVALPAGVTALTLRKDGLLSRDRTLLAGDAPVARLRSDRWSDGADLTTADGAWRCRRTGFWRRTGELLVETTGERAGTITSRGLLGRTSDLTLDGHALVLTRSGGWGQRFALEDAQGTTRAEIRPRRSDLDVVLAGGASPLELGVACWLVLAILRGEAAAASGAASVAATSS